MTRKITVTLTEDQASVLVYLLEKQNADIGDRLHLQPIADAVAFNRRLATLIKNKLK